MNSIKVCEYSRSRSFHDDLILQDQASGERSQDQWSSGLSKLSVFLFCFENTEETIERRTDLQFQLIHIPHRSKRYHQH